MSATDTNNKDIGEIASFTITTTTGKTFTFAASEMSAFNLRSLADAIDAWDSQLDDEGAWTNGDPNWQRLKDLLEVQAQRDDDRVRANPF